MTEQSNIFGFLQSLTPGDELATPPAQVTSRYVPGITFTKFVVPDENITAFELSRKLEVDDRGVAFVDRREQGGDLTRAVVVQFKGAKAVQLPLRVVQHDELSLARFSIPHRSSPQIGVFVGYETSAENEARDAEQHVDRAAVLRRYYAGDQYLLPVARFGSGDAFKEIPYPLTDSVLPNRPAEMAAATEVELFSRLGFRPETTRGVLYAVTVFAAQKPGEQNRAQQDPIKAHETYVYNVATYRMNVDQDTGDRDALTMQSSISLSPEGV